MNKRVIKKMNKNSNTISNSTTFIQKKHNSLLWRLLSNVHPIKLIYYRLIFHNFNKLERLI